MVLREAQARILMLETGCNRSKYQKGFTLIEILVVLIIIGISTTLITLNFSTLKSIDSQINSFEKSVNFLTEESIVTGNIIAWHLSSNKQFANYIFDNENLENEDLVAWITMGFHHVPMAEDWPIMPVEYAGFTLLPVGFFDQNPALDVAPPLKACHD